MRDFRHSRWALLKEDLRASSTWSASDCTTFMQLVLLKARKSSSASSLGRTALALKLFDALFFDVLLLYWLGARRRGLGPEAGP